MSISTSKQLKKTESKKTAISDTSALGIDPDFQPISPTSFAQRLIANHHFKTFSLRYK